MKTIGLLGGMSWESSLEYYRIMNEEVKKRLGKSHSAKLIMYSFDFQVMKENMELGNWNQIRTDLIEQSINLKNAGAELIVICTNTMHLMADDIEESTGLPVIHIADVTGREIVKKGLKKVLLLGTKFTMLGTFYSDVLRNKHGIDVIIPNEEDVELINEIIFQELVIGVITDESKSKYIDVISRYKEAEGVILGCTEIPLLIKQNDVNIPVFDTTAIHSVSAIEYVLKI